MLPLLAIALFVVPSVAATAGAGDDAKTLFARPYIMRVMEPDPWMGGAWFATDGGLFFKDLDGGSVRIYSITDGLPSAIVQDVSVTQTQVWVGTLAGAAVLDKATQSVHWLHASDGSPYTYPTQTVYADHDAVWLGTATFGLFRVDPVTLEVTAVPNPVDGSSFTKPITGLASVGDELYVSVFGYGLVRWDRSTGQSWRYHDAYNHPDDPPYFRIAASPAAVWIATDGDGVLRLDRGDWSLMEYASPQTVNDLNVFAATVIGDTVWFATHDGAARYDAATGTWLSWRDVLPGDAANDIALVDGAVYAATAGGQTARYDVSQQDWVAAHWWETDRTPRYNVVNSCQVDGSRLLFGTGGGGANFYDPRSGLWTKAGEEPGDQGQLSDILVWRTATDDTTHFYATNLGVTEVDKATGQTTHYYSDGRTTTRGANPVRDVEIAGDTVWFATHYDKPRTREGTFQYPGMVTRMDRHTHAMTFYGTAAGLTDGNVTRAVPDGDLVWIGMEKGGLDVLDQGTGKIQHVYTGQGSVSDILVRPDGVWLAAGLDGVLRVDPVSLTVTPILTPAGVAARTLLDDGTTIWVGTAYKGLYAIDPTSLQATHYGTSSHIDYLSYCLAEHEGRLYVGTGWGIERFDLATHRFLPQAGRLAAGLTTAVEDGADGDAASNPAITIDAPADSTAVTPGSALSVHGTADAAGGSQVFVRLGDGEWQAADGLATWSTALTAPTDVGPTILTARLETDGQTVAQAAVDLYVGVDAAQASTLTTQAAALHHAPILEAGADEPLAFRVDGASGLPAASAQVELRRPGAATFDVVPMVLANGSFVADVPPLGVDGDAAYRILVQWSGGSMRFPEPFSGYGSAYPLAVQPSSADAPLLIAGSKTVSGAAGQRTHVDLAVQNPGTRSSLVAVGAFGPASAWLAQPPRSMRLNASTTQVLGLDIDVPAGTSDGHYVVDLVFAPASGSSTQRTRLDIAVGHVSPASGSSSRLSPVPGWPLAVALIGLALARRRWP